MLKNKPEQNLNSDADHNIERAALRIYTLGGFRVLRNNQEIPSGEWGRDKAVQLFQYLVTMRHRQLHKEQIIDQLWPDLDIASGDRDFKVALNAVNRALEPARKPRTQPRYILRSELVYYLNTNNVWIDADVFENSLNSAHRTYEKDPQGSLPGYRQSVEHYAGEYLPERRYEDWTSAERERLELLALGAMIRLADLLVLQNPDESIFWTQRVLTMDRGWEDAYRVQMRAYMQQGNRPLAIRTYQQCQAALKDLFGIDPLPETSKFFKELMNA